MTDATIERILFNAPKPSVPSGLLQSLKDGIALPSTRPAPARNGAWQNPMRRWFPALAFSLFLVSCAIMIAVQGSFTLSLKRQNQQLKAATADLPQLREHHAAYEQAVAQQDELTQLRKDNDEMHALQARIAQLQNIAGKIRELQSANQQLRQSMTALAASDNAGDFFDEAQRQADRIACVNNLKQLGLAMRIWAGDNNDKYPTSLVTMSNELATTKILICPGDKARQSYSTLGWNTFQDNMTSYQYLAQPDDQNFPDCITAFCPIHNNYLLADGSVQQINPDRMRMVKKDGRWYLQAVNDSTK